jgi:hypothetical protein
VAYKVNDSESGASCERPWIELKTTHDVEAWIVSYDRDLQQRMKNPGAAGCGICLVLREGGEIFMHTTAEGDVLLDVTPEAQWATPVIAAATRLPVPGSQIWALPGDTLTQLVLGLSSLIASTRMVSSHDFGTRKTWRMQ